MQDYGSSRYVYFGNCVSSTYEDISALRDSARPVRRR
jgi:hypothetical protein